MVSYFTIVEAYKQMMNSKSKSALPMSYIDVKTLRVLMTPVPRILRERLIAPPEGLCVYRNNFAATLHVKIMDALITAGIPQHWYKFTVEFELRSVPDPPREPKVFSIEDLKYGFIIWLVAISVSVGSFLLECCIYFNILAIRSMVGVYVFLKCFKQLRTKFQ